MKNNESFELDNNDSESADNAYQNALDLQPDLTMILFKIITALENQQETLKQIAKNQNL